MSTEQSLSTFQFYDAPQYTTLLAIDLVDACNLSCPTCPRGLRYMKNSKRQMDYDLFRKIIDKSVQLNLHYVSLYNWTEPFLCCELEHYAAYVKEKGLFCQLSSNLPFPHLPHLIPSLKFCDKLIVSVSGFSQDVYQINHRGGNISFVKHNIDRIAAAKKHEEIETDVYIRYFIFDYSESEYHLFEDFACSHGLHIQCWRGGGNPMRHINPMRKHDEGAWLQHEANLQYLPDMYKCITESTDKMCRVAIDPVNIDWRGDVSLCCLKPAFGCTRIGNFLEDDFDVIQYRRATHPLCTTCQKPWGRITSLPYHKMSLLRGMMKTLGTDADFLAATAAEAAVAARLAGREVYFWGCGGMFRRKRHVFYETKPVCILADIDKRPTVVDGLPVLHPDEVLRNGKILPVVVFAGEEAGKCISQTIREKYPQLIEIYSCSTL